MLVALGIIPVGTGLYYCVRVIAAMSWQEPNDDTPIRVRFLTRVTVAVLTLLIFVLRIFPQPVLSMLRPSPLEQAPVQIARRCARRSAVRCSLPDRGKAPQARCRVHHTCRAGRRQRASLPRALPSAAGLPR